MALHRALLRVLPVGGLLIGSWLAPGLTAPEAALSTSNSAVVVLALPTGTGTGHCTATKNSPLHSHCRRTSAPLSWAS